MRVWREYKELWLSVLFMGALFAFGSFAAGLPVTPERARAQVWGRCGDVCRHVCNTPCGGHEGIHVACVQDCVRRAEAEKP